MKKLLVLIKTSIILTALGILVISKASASIAYNSNVFNYVVGPSSPQSISFNNVGGNAVLLYIQGSTSQTISAVTYGGVAMTQVATENPQGSDRTWLFITLYAPTGTNNFSVTFTGAGDWSTQAVSYSGVGAYEAYTSNFQSGTAKSITITPTLNNSWVVAAFRSNYCGAISPDAGTTLRGTASNFVGFYDNNAAISPASATTLNGTAALSGNSYAMGIALNSGVPPQMSPPMKVLVVAGGGGGGGFNNLSGNGGGGGGGGVFFSNSYSIPLGSYSITIGSGGLGGQRSSPLYHGQDGGNSIFEAITAIGGGGGASDNPPSVGHNGGSGGGGANSPGQIGGNGTTLQGNNGGTAAGGYVGGGGGGGAGAVGGNASSNNNGQAGIGGDGIAYTISGSSVYYGAGGGGGKDGRLGGTAGTGGNIGGGNGSNSSSNGQNGTTNTGGGGGGGGYNTAYGTGGNGGSGIVIISYPTGTLSATGGTITTSGGNTIHTFTSSGTYTVTAVAILIDSYSETNTSEDQGLNSTIFTRWGQSFTTPNNGTSYTLSNALFYLKKGTGSPTGTIVAKLYSHSGTYGTSSIGGSVLATSTNSQNASALTTSYQLISFNFDNTYTMIPNTHYVILVEISGGGADYTMVGYDNSSPTHSGNGMYYEINTPAWAAQTNRDQPFYVYGFVSPSFAPTITTQAVTSITSTTAIGNGNVTSDGGATITERGVCWNTSATPTTANSKSTSSGTTGSFTSSMTGLTSGTLYYVRAYAINSVGISYGNQVTFSTPATATVNWNNSNVQEITLAANRSLSFINGKSGGLYTLIIKQNSTGGWTVSWPSNVKWPGGIMPIFTTTANAVDLVKFAFDGTIYIGYLTALDAK
ncbi:MAG: hypothetical protein HGB12_00095 [Bacteroidetes bacterium]|nr:hypothetical protein [Bacteroidota bacterium]